MRALILLFLLLFSSFSFAQNVGLIVGKVMDKELNNEPMIFANVSVKGTTTEFTSDINGMFLIDNLEEGNHTLVCHFIGYETKELNVLIISGQPTEVNISLSASTISLSELTSLISNAKKEDKTFTSINN